MAPEVEGVSRRVTRLDASTIQGIRRNDTLIPFLGIELIGNITEDREARLEGRYPLHVLFTKTWSAFLSLLLEKRPCCRLG